MKLRRLAVAVASMFATAGAAISQVPVEDLGRYPAMDRLSMSPDGRYVIGLMVPPGNEGDEQGLVLWDLSKPGSAPKFTPGNDRMHFISARALESGKFIVTARQAWTGAMAGCVEGKSTGATKTFVTKTYMTDADLEDFDQPFAPAGATETLCDNVATATGTIGNSLPLDDGEVIVLRRSRNAQYGEFVRYNLETGRAKVLYRNNDIDNAGLWDGRTGELLTKNRLDVAPNDDYFFTPLIVDENGDFQKHDELTTTARARGTTNIVGRDEASGKYYVITDKFSDNTALYFYDAKTREFDKEPLFAHPDYNVSNVLLGFRPSRFNQVLGVSILGPEAETFFVHPDLASIKAGLEQAFPGKVITVRNWTDDLNTVLFSTSSTVDTVTYYILKDKTTPLLLGAQRPWLNPDELGKTEFVTYKARDGLTIPGFLATPPGWKKGDAPVPTVIMPHGGPWSRDYLDSNSGGDTWIHFFTSRGFAVLKPQYRGSEDWGKELWFAGDNEWGQKMQDDKDDGAAWLVSEGIADPDKLVMFGYSYGGFAAFAASVRENSPYQCAIAGAGVSRLERIANNWGQGRVQRAFQARTVGGMDPIANTDKLNIPLLIVHGDRDVRVPLYHATNFYNKVKDNPRGLPVEMVIVKDMPHSYPWWPSHFNTMFEAIDEFLGDECGVK